MHISPFFRNLRSAYYAEIDDLTFDSDGQHVLAQRLKQRRKEIDFLVHMLELSPEMVAVVLHKGFQFKDAGAMENVLRREADALPQWSTVAASLTMETWTEPLVKVVLKQPLGEWFLTVAAGLEYLFHQPQGLKSASSGDDDEADNEDESEEEIEERTRQEAGADWMAEQGFDRKE